MTFSPWLCLDLLNRRTSIDNGKGVYLPCLFARAIAHVCKDDGWDWPAFSFGCQLAMMCFKWGIECGCGIKGQGVLWYILLSSWSGVWRYLSLSCTSWYGVQLDKRSQRKELTFEYCWQFHKQNATGQSTKWGLSVRQKMGINQMLFSNRQQSVWQSPESLECECYTCSSINQRQYRFDAIEFCNVHFWGCGCGLNSQGLE